MEAIEEQYFDNWKIGSETNTGSKISHIFYRTKRNYIIYESDKSSLVSYDCNEKLDYKKKLLNFEQQLSLIKGLLADNGLQKRFRPRIAAAMNCCFKDKGEVAQQILEDVIKSIKKYKENKGRLEYLLGSLILGVLVVVLKLLADCFNMNTSTESILNISLLSIAGGFLSISTNLKKIDIDIESGNLYIHGITGMTRILISIISGIVVYYLIESNLILSGIIDNNKESVTYVFAAISGFSERLIPNILNRIEKTTTNNV